MLKENNVKRSREERLINERLARKAQEFVSSSKEVYKNRFKGLNKKIPIKNLDDELIEDMDNIFG